MIFPRLVYSELRKLNMDSVNKDDVTHKRRVRRLDLAEVVRQEGVPRPRFRKLNTPMGPSRLVSIPHNTGPPNSQQVRFADDLEDAMGRLPRPSRRYVDEQNLSGVDGLEGEAQQLQEDSASTSLTLEEAAAMLEKAYGPEKLFVWLMKILIFSGTMLGTLGFALTIPNSSPSLPSFTLWAACTVGAATAVTLFGCITVSFARRVVELPTATYMNALNAGLASVASTTLLWYFYGLLTIGKKDSTSVRNNLAKLLWPLTFPLQGTPFVVGAAFLTLMLLLYMVTSYKSTPVGGSNPAVFTTGFLLFTALMGAFVQIMANRGYVVCDIRGNPWVDSSDSIYSVWNRTYSIWLTVNSVVAISFMLSIAGDLELDRRLGLNGVLKGVPVLRVAHNIVIAAGYLGFMLFDVTSSQGKNDVMESGSGSTTKKEMMFHSVFNLGVLGLAGVVSFLQIDWFTAVAQNAGGGRMQDEYKKED
jgi:hypothetical protein